MPVDPSQPGSVMSDSGSDDLDNSSNNPAVSSDLTSGVGGVNAPSGADLSPIPWEDQWADSAGSREMVMRAEGDHTGLQNVYAASADAVKTDASGMSDMMSGGGTSEIPDVDPVTWWIANGNGNGNGTGEGGDGTSATETDSTGNSNSKTSGTPPVSLPSPDRIASLTPKEIKEQTADQIKALTIDHFKAMTLDQFSALTDAHLAALGGLLKSDKDSAEFARIFVQKAEAKEATRQLDLSKMAGDQIRNLTAEQVALLSGSQLTTLDGDAIPVYRALTREQIKQVHAKTLATLSACLSDTNTVTGDSILSELAGSQLKAFDGLLSSAQIQSLSDTQLAELADGGAAIVSMKDLQGGGMIADLTTSQVFSILARLRAGGIQQLTPAQIQALTPAAIQVLTAGQIQAFTSAQFQVLTAEQIYHMTVAQIAALMPAQIGALTPAQAVGLNWFQIQALTPTQIQAITPVALQALTQGQLDALNAGQIQALTAGQVAALTAEQIYHMTLAQIVALTPVQIGAFSPAQVDVLTWFQIQALTSTQIQSLAPAQIQALKRDQIDALTAGQVEALTSAQIAALTPDQMRVLKLVQIAALTTAALQALTPGQLDALNAVQIQALTLTQIAALTPAQVSALTPAQVSALTPDQIQALTADVDTSQDNGRSSDPTGTIEAEFDPNNLNNLTKSQFQNLTKAQIKKIKPLALATMDSPHYAMLTVWLLRKLSNEQTVALMIPLVPEQAIWGLTMSALSPLHVRRLTQGQVSWLISEQVLSNDRYGDPILGDFTAEQIRALSGLPLSHLSAKQLTTKIFTFPQSNTTVIAVLLPSQVGLLDPSALTSSLVQSLTAFQVGGLTALQLGSTGSDNTQILADLLPAQISGISSSAFTTTLVQGLTVQQVGGLTAAQLGGTASDNTQILAYLLPAQISGISSSTFTTTLVQGLTVQQVGGLTAAQLGGTALDNTRILADLLPAQISGISSSTLNTTLVHGLTSQQVGGLTAAQLGGTGADNTQILADLTPDQITNLNPSSLAGASLGQLTPAQVASLSATQLAGTDGNRQILLLDLASGPNSQYLTAAQLSYSTLLNALVNLESLIGAGGTTSTQESGLQALYSECVKDVDGPTSYLTSILGSLVKHTQVGTGQAAFTALVGQWFQGTDNPDLTYSKSYNVSNQNYNMTYKDFSDSQLFPMIYGTNTIDKSEIPDISQNEFGNCTIVASLISLATVNPDKVISEFTENTCNDTFGVEFYGPQGPNWVTVDAELPVLQNGAMADVTSVSSAIWASIYSKALIEASSDGLTYYSFFSEKIKEKSVANSYDFYENYGHPLLPGMTATGLDIQEYYLNDQSALQQGGAIYQAVSDALANGRPVIFGSDVEKFGLVGGDRDAGHAYAVASVSNGYYNLVNPWGAKSSNYPKNVSLDAAQLVQLVSQDMFFVSVAPGTPLDNSPPPPDFIGTGDAHALVHAMASFTGNLGSTSGPMTTNLTNQSMTAALSASPV